MITIDDILAELPQIDPKARYWFFRTEGGKLFAHFVASGTIAIGYSKISLKTLADLQGENIRDSLRAVFAKAYPDKKSNGFAVLLILVRTHVVEIY